MAIDLATNNGNKRSVFHGVDPDDQAGFSVSSAGDINGDGFADFIIGAILRARETRTAAPMRIAARPM